MSDNPPTGSAVYETLCAGLEPLIGVLTARKAIEVACAREKVGRATLLGLHDLPKVLDGLRPILQGLIGRKTTETLLAELATKARRASP